MIPTTQSMHSFDSYNPQYLDSRLDNPIIQPSAQRLLSRSVTASSNYEQLTKKPTTKSDRLLTNINTNQGLPDDDITQKVNNNQEKSVLRDPAGRNIPKLIMNDNLNNQAFHSTTHSLSNFDNKHNESYKHFEPNKHIEANRYMESNKPFESNKPLEANKPSASYANQYLSSKVKPQPTSTEINKKQQQQQPVSTEVNKQQQPVTKVVEEDTKPLNGYWKTGTLFNKQGVVAIGPIIYDDNSYVGPFGLNQTGAYIFYIGMTVFIFLAGIFLIMCLVFYGQKYPDPTKNSGTLAGIGICAFAFYLGIQIILIGLWYQKYRQEHPKKKIPHQKPRLMYTPYGYYLYPQYFSDINEQLHMQQYGTLKTEPDTKTVPLTKPVEVISAKSEVNNMRTISDNKEQPIILSKPEFYYMESVSDIVEPVSSIEQKINEKIDSTKTLSTGTKQTTGKSSTDVDISKKNKQTKPIDNKTIISSSNDRRTVVTESHPPPSVSQIVSKTHEDTSSDLQIEDIKADNQRTKIKNNKLSSGKIMTNAFYDEMFNNM
ncbi:unnamed protein product [Adineta steineri]|uniref:Uncharacterized protein n=1 Tax=Adineta steineri TaxID=433720 RepID=A0A815UZ40_9BILA|nr:unnamed protein product [Adineta steineri]